MTMRWRKNPHETGLRSIGAGERGYKLFCDGESVASVNALHWRYFPNGGWYWVVSHPFPYMNTCNEPVASADEAKAAAMAYVKSCMSAPVTTDTPARKDVTA